MPDERAARASVRAALAAAARALAPGGSARLDAELLLAHVLGVPRSALYAAPERELEAAERARYDALVAARAEGVPLPYLTGRAEFWSLPLTLTPDVLVPRPETELLVEAGLAAVPAGAARTIVDLGTGSGAVALALARERPRARVIATDRSCAALGVARGNAADLGLANVELVAADWLGAFGDAVFDVILANPPYVAADERDALGRELDYEPGASLFAADGGLAALAAIAAAAPRCLRPGGAVALEHGARQGAAVRALFAAAGLVAIETLPDLAGHERVTRAARPAA